MQTPLHALFEGDERIYWAYLLASALVALAFALLRGESVSAARLKAYFWSTGARLDYRYFLVDWLFKALLIAPLVLSAQTVALWTLEAMNTVAEPLFLPWRFRYIALAYTLALFVASDFSRYWLHRWLHRSRWLWLFHQVHHSAEALNPLTYYRVHPVENLLFALRHAAVAGLVTGIFVFCFGSRLDLYTIFGSNLFIVALFAFTGNLRHSHVRLGYGPLERLLVSPAQHQIHHEVRHMQENFGSTLAVWDWMFGTLRRSRDVPRRLGFGLGEGRARDFDGVVKLLVRPFMEILARLRGRRVPARPIKAGILALLMALAASQARAGEPPVSEAELGKLLFFDTAFSLNRTMACASCHHPDTAFTDQRGGAPGNMVSLGDDGRSIGHRNAPTATYASTSPRFHFDERLKEYVGGLFHDGRAATQAEQAMGPPLNAREMALPDAAELVRRLRANPVYEEAFTRLYGRGIFDAPRDPSATPPAYAAFGRAIQAFEKTDELSSYDSKYDRYLEGEYELTALEDLGRTLFFSNQNVSCASCHKLRPEDSAREPFTNHRYRNIGVPSNPALLALADPGKDFIDHGLLENPAVTDEKYDGKFRNPTLRNVAVTGPYMHNGVFRDLRTVVEFYDHYNNPKRRLNPETGEPWAAPEVPSTIDREELKSPPLSDRKVDALVAFLQALTDRRYEPLLQKNLADSAEAGK